MPRLDDPQFQPGCVGTCVITQKKFADPQKPIFPAHFRRRHIRQNSQRRDQRQRRRQFGKSPGCHNVIRRPTIPFHRKRPPENRFDKPNNRKPRPLPRRQTPRRQINNNNLPTLAAPIPRRPPEVVSAVHTDVFFFQRFHKPDPFIVAEAFQFPKKYIIAPASPKPYNMFDV